MERTDGRTSGANGVAETMSGIGAAAVGAGTLILVLLAIRRVRAPRPVVPGGDGVAGRDRAASLGSSAPPAPAGARSHPWLWPGGRPTA